MENQKRKGSAGTIALVILLLIVTIASLVLATYAWAKYTTTKSGKAEVAVAKWDVNFSGTQTNHSYKHVVADRLAPGTTGQFAMTLTAPNTEVDFSYVISIANLTKKPTNLKFYAKYDSSTDTYSEQITDMTNSITGTYVAGTGFQPYKINGTTNTSNSGNAAPVIYWKWDYETNVAVTTIPASSPAAAGDMMNAMIDLANAVRVTNNESAITLAELKTAASVSVEDANMTDANKLAVAQKALDDALVSNNRTAATNIQVNDAIDTAEGKTAPTMSFDASFTATQTTPVKNNN